MTYNYETEKPWLFTDEGQRALLKSRDKVFVLLDSAGAFMSFLALDGVADTFKAMAILDRLVELKDIVEITDKNVRGQDRVFIRPYRGR